MTADPSALLTVRGLQIGYETRAGLVPAVSGVDFEIARGEIVAIVGESGSGKSTTAQAVINLLDPSARLSAETLDFDGTDLRALSHAGWRELRSVRIGLIPQDPGVSLDPVKRIGDQVAESLRVHRLAGRREAAARAVELLRIAGIPDPGLRARQFPHQLSGGMKQRALIAAALAADPELIIADEPTSALDVTVQKQILDHLENLVRERGTAVLLITHDLAVAGDRADRVLVMQSGRIVEQGTADAVLRRPRHDDTRRLVAAAPALSSGRLEPSVAAARVDAEPPVVLSACGLIKDFPLPGRRHLRAVDDVSFEIRRGRTFALVGESGSGKSTTSRLVARLEPVTAGRLAFDGTDYTDIRGERLRELRQRFQLVYQNPYASLDPRFTIADTIDEPLRAYGVSATDRGSRVRDLLGLVALPTSFLGRRPAELSGGQRQRVAIARALALQPDLVILDEAVSALDVSVQAQILQLLTDLQAELGVAYLFITHDLAVVRQIADSVGVMHRARLVETGTTDEVLHSPREEYTQRLIDAIPGSVSLA
jgi:peptide/nickel transport system ATP-binding protein